MRGEEGPTLFKDKDIYKAKVQSREPIRSLVLQSQLSGNNNIGNIFTE